MPTSSRLSVLIRVAAKIIGLPMTMLSEIIDCAIVRKAHVVAADSGQLL